MKLGEDRVLDCHIDEERFEEYSSTIHNSIMVYYEFKRSDGRKFTCVLHTLEECRKAKNDWLDKYTVKVNFAILSKTVDALNIIQKKTFRAKSDIIDFLVDEYLQKHPEFTSESNTATE